MSVDFWLVLQERKEYERRRQAANTEAGEDWFHVPSKAKCFEFGDGKDAGGNLLARVALLDGVIACENLSGLEKVFQDTSDHSPEAWESIKAAAQGDPGLRAYFWLE